MENQKKQTFFLVAWGGGVKLGFLLLNWGKHILFCIGNGAEFGPQNWVIESSGFD